MALYENLNLEKGMYNVSGKNFTQVLESLDPSENYKGTKLDGLDAFERQLKRFDIKVSGEKSDNVEKFFSTSTSSALFPEYVKRAINVGASSEDILGNIIASKTYVDSLDYRSITSVLADGDKVLSPIAEGGTIPTTTIKSSDSLVKLKKRGRMLVSSYEAIKFQRLDLFTVTLRQIGMQIAKQHLKDAVDVLINGDGNENGSEKITMSNNNLTYADLLRLWGKFEDFNMNTMLAGPDATLKLLALNELQDNSTGLSFQTNGKLVTPLGASLYKSNAVAGNTIIGFDKNCALEMVCAGDIAVEYDKLIDQQLERATISSIAGFAKIFQDASKVLVVGAGA